ncbi:unnamed protein product [Trifolium pratense]|uniref:Uncharacterized protein n=1 Tax=Trifolium pratense TaxID=57577 RepID=A0ACB0IM25_TRIPR|nr:unnamed protein product [Trifolium pratense]
MASSSSSFSINGPQPQTMAPSTRQVEVKNKGKFVTAYIIDQPYGEMSPKIIEKIYHELEEEVVVFDSENRSLKVKFNRSIQHPLIVGGWSEMRAHFGIDRNRMLVMTYVGKNRFILDFLNQEFNPNKLPTYHSYYHFAVDPVTFNVTLTPYLASGSQLSLNKDFATYIRNSGFDSVVLYGPQGDEVPCKLVLKNSRNKEYTKIGTGWKNFININGFVAGDVLNLKFVNKANSNLMKVVKI